MGLSPRIVPRPLRARAYLFNIQPTIHDEDESDGNGSSRGSILNQLKMTMRCSMLLIIIPMGLLAADAFSPPRVRISPLPSKISIQQIHRSRQQRRQQHNNPLHRLYFREAVDDNDTSTSRKTNGIYNRNDFPTDNTASNNNNNTKQRNKDKIKAKSASRLLKAKRLLGMLCRYYLQVFICCCCVVWLYIIFVGICLG